MAESKRKLRLPGAVSWSTLGIALALAGAGCGDDGSTPRDASADARVADSGMDGGGGDAGMDAGQCPMPRGPGCPDAGPEPLFCIYDTSFDGGRDAAPFDAASCSGTAFDPEDCPNGCRAVG